MSDRTIFRIVGVERIGDDNFSLRLKRMKQAKNTFSTKLGELYEVDDVIIHCSLPALRELGALIGEPAQITVHVEGKAVAL